MQVTFRFPSKLQYAYTEVTGTPEELAAVDPEALGMLFMQAMHAYGEAEVKAVDLIKGGVTAPPEAYEDTRGSNVTESPESDDETAEAVQVIKDELGATESIKAPYDSPAPAAKVKPWAKKKTATKVDLDDFGF